MKPAGLLAIIGGMFDQAFPRVKAAPEDLYSHRQFRARKPRQGRRSRTGYFKSGRGVLESECNCRHCKEGETRSHCAQLSKSYRRILKLKEA